MNFHHILWVDDEISPGAKGASRFSPTAKSSGRIRIEENFGDYADGVNLCQSFDEMVDIICSEKIFSYDCVILDINLSKGSSKIDKAKLKKYGVDINNPHKKQDIKLLENGGYFLYLLLLNRGFPSSRVRILSAHGGDDEELKESQLQILDKFKSASIRIPDSFGDNKHAILSPKLDELYNGDNHYYIVRALVFYACDTIRNHISDTNDYEIPSNLPFNNFVYGDDNKLNADTIRIMLDNICLQLPIINDIDNKRLSRHYKIILQLFSENFHANFNKSQKHSHENDFIYWKIIKLLRNWTAHGKMKEDILDSITFLILFILIVHAMFGQFIDLENSILNFINKYIVNQTAAYQNGFISSNHPREDIQKQFISLYTKFADFKLQDSVLSTSYYDMLEKLGGRNSKDFQGQYILFLKLICLLPVEKSNIMIDNNSMKINWNIDDKIIDSVLGKPLNEDDEFLTTLRKASLNYLNNCN